LKKCVEKAFALALIIVSLVGTFLQTELISSIIYVIIIPSFILSIVSFFSEISVECQENAEKTSKLAHELSDLEQESVHTDLKLYEKGEYEVPYNEETVPNKIYEQQLKSNEHLAESIIYIMMATFFVKIKKVLDKAIFVGYLMLFLSLIFCPYFYKWLSNINLNCLTLWSLALLYITLELKSEFISKIYDYVYKICKIKRAKENKGKL